MFSTIPYLIFAMIAMWFSISALVANRTLGQTVVTVIIVSANVFGVYKLMNGEFTAPAVVIGLAFAFSIVVWTIVSIHKSVTPLVEWS